MITVQCIHCAKEFGTYPYRRDSAKFCSKECATKHNQKPTIICPTCKKAFIRKKPEMKYCSHECACVESRNRVDFTCLVCGKPFERRCSDVARGQGVYCSPECLSVSQTRKVETQCAQCGKVFEFSPSADKKFCSPECYWQSLGEPRREYECKQCHRLFVAHPAEKKKILYTRMLSPAQGENVYRTKGPRFARCHGPCVL